MNTSTKLSASQKGFTPLFIITSRKPRAFSPRKFIALGIILVIGIVAGVYYFGRKYSFEGGQCGGFTPSPKGCFYGLRCQYPPNIIDAFGICVQK